MALVTVGYAEDITTAREKALDSQAYLLANSLYENAEKNRRRAEKNAENNPQRSARSKNIAIDYYNQAYELATKNSIFLEETLKARNLTITKVSDTLGNESWSQAEKLLQQSLFELNRNRTEKAREIAFSAIKYFDDAIVESIQDRMLKIAREKINTAYNLKAERYAPVTIKLATTVETQVENLLTKDRTQLKEAEFLSKEVEAYADKAIQITQLAKGKPSYETTIRDSESRLHRLLIAAGKDVPLNFNPELSTTTLENEIQRLRSQERDLNNQINNSRQFIAALEDEIRDLDDRLGGVSTEKQSLIMQIELQARSLEKLNQVESTFSQDEAEIYSQSGNIVIRLIGLKFASGSAELGIESKNLLNKIAKVVDLYTNSSVLIEGHTDSQGSAVENKKLSQIRADMILNQLVASMRIPAFRISSIGYGESKPIANNETELGREKNRRIDLIIIPQVLDSDLESR
ncbi:MAG: OmpA family protein [Pseudomonadota bacterium]|nr:OmpA family protein [Pseudomonadota bacterium]